MAIAATFWLAVGAAYADPGPTEQAPPTISGVAQQGQTLTVDPGTWTGDPITFTYLWSDGTIGDTDVLSAADVGQAVSVTVTATNDAGTASVTVSTDGPVLPAAPVLDASGPSPAIAGTAQQGVTLSVSSGNWDNDPTQFGYVWEDCDGTGTVCVPISGAASANSYTVQSTDVGSTIEVVVTASNAGGQGSATSNVTGTVLPPAPVLDAAGPSPAITGTAQQGVTLSVSNGNWDNDPTQFGYVWEDCDGTGTVCVPISGAASANTYALQSTDVGSTIEVIVTASNAGGGNQATTGPDGPVLPAAPVLDASGPSPAIAGTAQQGVTLSVSSGNWDNDPTQFGYVWEDCDGTGTVCVPISGAASANSYTVQSTDVGSTIEVVVTASNAGGGNQATTGPDGPVLPAAPVADSTGPPTIGGTPHQGDTLTVTSNGTWSNGPSQFNYEWEDCNATGTVCAPVAGAASSSTYTVQSTDVGSTIEAIVTASNAGGQNSVTSNGIGPVLPAAPTNSVAPVLSGTAQQGDKLTVANNGTWSDSPTQFGYVWEDCNTAGTVCAPISGAASSSTYTVQSTDVGSTIEVIVTASNAGGQNPATSNGLGPVLPAAPVPNGSGPPSIGGTPQQGDTLTVTSNGTWSNGPTQFSYQWEDCPSGGGSCSTIDDATSSYTLPQSDIGDTVEVVVTASNAGGQNSATSNGLGPVLPTAPANSGAPVLSGTAQQGDKLTVSNNGTWSNGPTPFSYQWQDCPAGGGNCTTINTPRAASAAVHRCGEHGRGGRDRFECGRAGLADEQQPRTGVARGARQHEGAGAQRHGAAGGHPDRYRRRDVEQQSNAVQLPMGGLPERRRKLLEGHRRYEQLHVAVDRCGEHRRGRRHGVERGRAGFRDKQQH